jgi:hypothetical protein
MFKKILAYIVCLFVPGSLEDPINNASSVEELDEMIIKKAGF